VTPSSVIEDSPSSNLRHVEPSLWCVTERAGARAVFAVKRNSV
jgi:hypothetical protein